ncbi:PAS domain S-box protein [Synechococcus sp. PCC 7336]|uniref:PAS domain S-box protein n=1 Tax=Synechococcus sp. PCC 7336 TaxID=195250 RepID=UPI00034596EF|nr:PAS domain S-box protein [Synechococcus sp. PCC 7336]
MKSDLDILQRKFDAAQNHLDSLLWRAGQEPQPSVIVAEALGELSIALEELHVISEELYAQSEQLQVSNQTLEAERKRYLELFEFAPDGYLVTDIQGIVREANSTAAKLLNYPARFLIGKPLAIAISPDQHKRFYTLLNHFYTLLNQMQQNSASMQAELMLQPRESDPFWAAFTISAARDDRDRVRGFRWAFRDLTESRRTKAALENSEARYRAIVEDQTELVCQFLADGRLTFVNSASCRYFAQRQEDLVSDNFLSYVLEDDRPAVQKYLDACSRRQSLGALESRAIPQNGKVRWIQWTFRALYDRQGRFFRFQSVGRDITARKQAGETLQRREAQLRLITDALPVAIAYIDTQEHYQFANQTCEVWFGRSRETILGRHLQDILGQIIYEEIREPIQAACSGEEVTVESEWLCGDGHPRSICATFIPHRDERGTVMGIFSLVIDISERKAIEQMKDEFLSIISHELRTPLTSIHGSLKLLATGELGTFSADGEEMLAVADENCDRLVRLINDLLDFQRLEAGRLTLHRQVWDAGEAIAKAAEAMQGMARERGISLETAPVSLSIWADPDYIMQTLTNLMGNAIKFSPEDSTVWINVRERGNEVLFSVIDRGQGIPADRLKNIFERFQQLDASTTRQKGGTGLGLAICRSIVEQHGGQIWAESTPGRGSTFYFTLPTGAHRHDPQTHPDRR